MGGEPVTFAGLAGMGDLIATCMSPHSRNRAVGEQLGRGRKLEEILAEMHMVAEGVNTAWSCWSWPSGTSSSSLSAGHRRVVRESSHRRTRYWGLTPAGHEAEPG